MAQDGPKMAQYGPKMAPRLVPNSYVSFMVAPKNQQSNQKNPSYFSGGPYNIQSSQKNQDDSKCIRNAPKMASKLSKMGPNWLQIGSRVAPKWLQEGSKNIQDTLTPCSEYP